MKNALIIFILIFSSPSFSQLEDDPSSKVIIKDNGSKDRTEVQSAVLCKGVMEEQQRLMQMIRPEYQQKIILKEATVLEVYRSDNSQGYAAKCILKFPSK